MRFPRGIGALGVAAVLAGPAPSVAQVREPPPAPDAAPVARPDIVGPPAICGAASHIARLPTPGSVAPSIRPPTAEPTLPAPLWYDQNPRLIRADHTGGLSLDSFLVAGDVETLTFERLSQTAESYVVREAWRRSGTTDIEGHLISVFNPSWDSAALWGGIGWQRRGFDRPYARFGTLLIPRSSDAANAGEDVVERFAIWLRLAPLNVPAAQVTQIDADTQYASHVVNLVMPGFGDARLSSGDYGHELDEAAKRFYAHFSDEYASIAFVPRQQHVVPYDAFHHNVRNPIAGLGALPVFDHTETYGSAGVLRSVELFPNVSFTSNASSTHAISHQWVDYWDWSRLGGGIELAGRDPASHTPLLYPGEVYAGAVLDVKRRLAEVGGGTSYAVERTPGPALLHPTTRYRMGLIGPEAVPELLVFENQGQLDGTGLVPLVGTTVDGAGRRVHVNDMLAVHGPRQGPVDDAWSRVSVVVSRDGLLSAEEMSYWNFFAARHAATGGTTTWDGVPSFFEATGGAAPLRTDVTPLLAAKLVEPVEAGDMPIAPGEFRDVELDAPVPARIVVGESVTIAGTVTTTERDDFNIACAWWNRYGSEDLIFECASIEGNRFSIPYRFTAGDAGRYSLLIYLYFPDAPLSPSHRSFISGITVAGTAIR